MRFLRLAYHFEILLTLFLGSFGFLWGCTKNQPLSSIQLTWDKNREYAVNASGGGYKVYYSRTKGFDISTGQVVDVPYTTGKYAPNSVIISGLAPATYYFKIQAYSALISPYTGTGSVSNPSDEITVTISNSGAP